MGGRQGPEGRSARGRSEEDEKDQEAPWEQRYCVGGAQGREPGEDLADVLFLQIRGPLFRIIGSCPAALISSSGRRNRLNSGSAQASRGHEA
jgi:hypothetical protein